MMDSEDTLDLATAEYYNLLVQGVPDRDEPTTEDLLKFLVGSCSPKEEEACLEALIQSPSLREELIQIQARFSQESLATLSQDPGFGGLLIASLRSAFDSLGGRLARGQAVPQFVWQSVGLEWRRLLDSPRFATVRGGGDSVAIRGTEQRLKLSADVVDGHLIIVLPSSAEVIDTLSLAVRDPGGALLPLWQGSLGSDSVSLRFEDLGRQLGFDEGRVPSNLFAISVVTSLVDQEGAIDLTLADGQVLRLPLIEPIAIKFGKLRVAVDVSQVDRRSSFDVQFLVQMGSIDLILGTASIQQQESVLRFETEVPQIDSLEIWGTSLIKMVSTA